MLRRLVVGGVPEQMQQDEEANGGLRCSGEGIGIVTHKNAASMVANLS